MGVVMSDIGSGTIDVPGIGRTKKVYVVAGGAAVALIVAYAYYRYAAAGKAADAAPDYYADLRTGSDTGDDAYPGATGSQSGTSGSDYYDSVTGTPTTDQQWTALVADKMSYLEPGYLLEVLGKYLDRKPLTADEATVIRSAWASAGHPPGNQPIVLATDNSSPGTVTIPNVPGPPTVASATSTSIVLKWTAVPGATKYRVYGPDTAVRETTTATVTISSLTPATAYTFSVAAVNSAGESNKSASTIGRTATTTKPPTKPPTKPATPTKPTTPVKTKPPVLTKPAPVKYAKVTVRKYTDHNPPWQSTISGIAGHYKTTTSAVWNFSMNAGLRAKRGSASNIQPGDTVYVKTK